jgi:hypothetical protein
LLEGREFAPPAGLRLLVRPGEFLLGSWIVAKSRSRKKLRTGHWR